MKSTFKTHSFRGAIALLTIGLITATASLVTQARDPANTPNQPSPTPVQPAPTSPDTPAASPSPPSSPPSSQPSHQSANPMESDRVDVEDVYPEYCRMYFPSRGTVSLFEYRERMYRCLHGVDRWFF